MTSCLCGTELIRGDGCDVLVVGLEASGKSLLCRRLQGLHPKDGISPEFNAYTVTTNGIQLTEVLCPKGTPFRSILLREVGGQMSPLWPQYYDDCRMVVFVVDVSDAPSIAPAAVELCDLMQHPKTLRKPLCVVLSKQDQALVLSRQEVELVMHLNDFERPSENGSFTVIELSAIPGGFAVTDSDGHQEMDGVERLLEWMIDRKCMALEVPLPIRKEHQQEGLFTPKWAST